MTHVLILTLLLIPVCYSTNPCCTNENYIIDRKCADGTPMKRLPCSQKYVVERELGVSVDDHNYLVIATARIPQDRFCASRRNNTDIYVVCFSDEIQDNTIYIAHAILELISVFFILLTIYVYSQLRDLLDLQGISILHSITGLALSFVALALNQLWTDGLDRTFCISLAYIIYFTMLYSFFWLNVLSFHIWRTIVRPRFLKMTNYWLPIYYIFGCGGPTVLTIILSVAQSMKTSDVHPGFGETKCWFKTTKTQFVYFYGPMAALLCLNVVYYGSTIANLWRNLNQTDEKKTKIMKYRLLLCAKLFFIMGISWIFELLSAAFQDIDPTLQFIWHVTDVLNTLQGIMIFLILVVFRKRVVRGLADRSFCGVRLPGRWRAVADDECEEIEEELNLSETQPQKF